MRDDPATSRKSRSRRRLALRVCFTVLMTLTTAELAMRIGFLIFVPHESLASLLNREHDLTSHVMSGRRSTQPNVLHPYVGFVVDPTRDARFNSWGFWQDDGPVLRRSPEQLIVGVTGGSVARDLCEFGGTTLRREIGRQFPGRQVRIVCLAQEGFREPQLAMTLCYFQFLGAEFDAVVSLSGFNEAALHPAESPDDEIWVGYPRGWNIWLTDTEDPEINRLIWQGQMLQIRRQKLASRFFTFRRLPFLAIHGVWSSMDSAYASQLADTATALTVRRAQMERRYANTGPAKVFESARLRREAQCQMWLDGSRQLHRLCRAADTEFLLCMQPNLHDEGMKPLTEEEKRLGASVYAAHIRNNYSYFSSSAAELTAEGIRFHDLRSLFRDSAETLYRDSCCHFNQTGTDRLASTIAALVSSALSAGEHSHRQANE